MNKDIEKNPSKTVKTTDGTKSPPMVRNVYGTNSLWYEKSGSLHLLHNKAVFCLQGLLILDEIPEILPEDGTQTASHNAMADIPGYSQPDDGKTCLQLLYKILYRAVLALTRNK